MGKVKSILTPLRLDGIKPAQKDGDRAVMTFKSPHSEVKVFFEWKGGRLWFLGKEVVHGHMKSIDGEEYRRGFRKLKHECECATGHPPKERYRADIHG